MLRTVWYQSFSYVSLAFHCRRATNYMYLQGLVYRSPEHPGSGPDPGFIGWLGESSLTPVRMHDTTLAASDGILGIY